MKKLIAVLFFCTFSLNAQNPPAPARSADAWKSLQFLIGTWNGKAEGGSAGASISGTYSFQPELQNHVLARHSTSDACKGPTDFDCLHQDLLYIYQNAPGQPFKAIFFDNEGHVIHYEVSTPTPTSVVFLSDSSQPGPQFRLTYELKDSVMQGKFQIRMPGQTDFKSYLEWSGTKK